MKIGAHCPVSKGYKNAVRHLIEAGGNSMQIFSGNPRGWSRKRLNPEKVREFINMREKEGVSPLAVHAPYLINIAGTGKVYDKSISALKTEFIRADKLKADYLILHPGNSQNLKEGIKRAAFAVTTAIEKTRPGVKLLIENTAGGGNSIGALPENLLLLNDTIKSETGFCFDTAHAFQAGLSARDMLPIAGKTEVIHINNSKTEFSSRRDRHAHIFSGAIKIETFKEIINLKPWRDKVFIIETPDAEKMDKKNIELLKSLRKSSS